MNLFSFPHRGVLPAAVLVVVLSALSVAVPSWARDESAHDHERARTALEAGVVHSVPCAQVVGVFVAFAGDAVIANMHSGR